MCEKCKTLVACPVGQKRRVDVDIPSDPEVTDAYGRKLFIPPVQIVIDKWPDSQVDCFLMQDVHDENNVGYGFGMEISHCPFCGQRLR